MVRFFLAETGRLPSLSGGREVLVLPGRSRPALLSGWDEVALLSGRVLVAVSVSLAGTAEQHGVDPAQSVS